MAEQIVNVSPGTVRVRGTRDGIVLSLPEDIPSEIIIAQICESVDQGGDFFRNSQVILDYGRRPPDEAEIRAIELALGGYGITVRSFHASRFDDRAALTELGKRQLRVVGRSSRPARREEVVEERQALYVRRTLRSGASLSSDGDLVVIGDVNPGAQVTAAGDVIVWGALRGTVHAGSGGDRGAMICALSLQPTQLRIGTLVARPPDDEEYVVAEPQRAYVDGSSIVVEAWRGNERRGR